MQPFKRNDRLRDHAKPIGEVLGELQSKLESYQSLKQQLGIADEVTTGRPSQHAENLTS